MYIIYMCVYLNIYVCVYIYIYFYLYLKMIKSQCSRNNRKWQATKAY